MNKKKFWKKFRIERPSKGRKMKLKKKYLATMHFEGSLRLNSRSFGISFHYILHMESWLIYFFTRYFTCEKSSNSVIISCPIFFVMPISRKKNSIKNCFHISTYFRFKINGEESVANCGYNKCDKTKPYGWNSQDVQNRNGFQCRFLLYFRIFVLFALHIIIIIFCENDVY